MKNTLKISFAIGAVGSGIVISLMKILQPITFFHITVFSYVIIISAVLAGFVSHRRFEGNKQQNTDKSGRHEIEHFMHKGKMATIYTKDGGILRGRFLFIDRMHVIMDYVHTGKKVASMLVLEKKNIKRMEVD